MSNTNNPIELLITLGVNTTTSITNINNQIAKLQTSINNLNLTLNIQGDTNFAKVLAQQLKGIKTEAKAAEEAVGGIGRGAPKNAGRILGGFKDSVIDSIRSLKELESYLKSQNYKYTVEMKVDERGREVVKRVVAQMKNQLGEIQTVRIKPIFDEKMGISRFEQDTTKRLNTDTYKLQEEMKKASDTLTDFARRGKLAASDYENYKKEIEKAPSLQALQKIVDKMKEVEKSTVFESKITGSAVKAENEVKRLNDQLDRLVRLYGKNLNDGVLTGIRKELQIISGIRINTTNDANIVQNKINNASKSIINLSQNTRDLKGFDGLMNKVVTEMKKIESYSYLSQKAIDSLYKRISNVPIGDVAKLEERFSRLTTITSKLAERKLVLQGIETNTRNVIALNAQLERAYNLNRKFANKDTYSSLQNEIKGLSNAQITKPADVDRVTASYKNLRQQINAFNADATQANRSSMTMLESFKVAMERFPIWMAASTVFYGAVRTARAFMETLIDIDTKLVSIQKVTGDGENIAYLFDKATESADRFGQSISSVLDAYIEFSRQGFKGEDLNTLSSAGLVAANVGEISAQNASEYLTASIVQWNKESSDAMGMIDSWNELANNYSTTVEKLAKGHARAGATARAIGMDFDQLNAVIGLVTAATKQSGDEVGNFVKNVLPRLTSRPAMNAMKSLGVSLTDGDGNIRDVIDVYTEIAHKIKDISDVQRVAVVEGLAGKYHISRMQILLNELGDADSLYQSMYESSTNSSGSALRENEVYMQSLQARINSVKVEFEKLAVAIGEAFLTDTMIAFMNGASSLLSVIASFVGSFGVLPGLLGALAAALVLGSSRFRGLALSIALFAKELVSSTKKTKDASDETDKLNDSTDKASDSAGKLGKAWKTMLLSLGAGVALFAVGFILEKIVSKLGEARQKAEEVASANKELVDSYAANAEELEILANRYSILSEKVSNQASPDMATLGEYYETQNKIGQLMPNLVIGENQYGQKLIGSSEALKIKLDLLKEQMEIEKERARILEQSSRNEQIEVYQGNLDNANEDIEERLEMFANLNSGSIKTRDIPSEYIIDFKDKDGKPIYNSIQKLAELLTEVEIKRKNINAEENPELARYYDSIISSINQYNRVLTNADTAQRDSITQLKANYIPIIEETIVANNGLTESLKETASTLSAQLMNAADAGNIDGLKNALVSLSSASGAWTVYEDVNKIFNDLNSATAENFASMSFTASTAIDSIRDKLLGLGLSTKDADVIIAALNNRLETMRAIQADNNDEMKKSGKTLGEVAAAVMLGSDTSDQMTESTSNLTASLEELSNAAEQMAGFSQKQVDTTTDLLLQYEMLSNRLVSLSEDELEALRTKENLTDAEAMLLDILQQRDGVLTSLTGIYPNLIASDGALIESSYDKIAAIEAENQANQKILEAYELLADGKLTAEEKMTVATATGLKQRIEYYKAEIAATHQLLNAVMEMHEENEDFVTRSAKAALEADISNYAKELDALIPDFETSVSKVDNIVKSHEKSQEKSKEATKETTYVTDKYKQALEAVNYEIERQVKLQATLPEHGEEYRKSLQAQIKLEKEKLALQQKQSKELESQIKSGKIKQTGSVSSSTSSSSSSSSERNLNGWSGPVTQRYGNNGHRGMDVDGTRGQRIDANVGGEVIASGKATSEGYHWSYGNIVVIRDSNGAEHLYAHLDKTIAKFGQIIQAGQQVGTIGNSGNVIKGAGGDGSHLHYEISMNGKLIDPASYVKDAKNGLVSITTQTNDAVVDTAQLIDQAKSDLISVKTDILDQYNTISELEVAFVESYLNAYEAKKSNYDKTLENSENRLRKLDSTSKEYREELDRQVNTLKAKKAENLAEITYLKDVIKNGGLSARAIYELNERLHELGLQKSEIDFAIDDTVQLQLESVLSYYNKLRQKQDDAIEYENVRIEELDRSSSHYIKTLEKINVAMSEKQKLNKQELISLNQMISSGKYHGQTLEQMTQRYSELLSEIQQMAIDIRKLDYDIVISVKTQYDDKIDNVQYQIDRLEAIKGLYEEGSGDSVSVIKEQITLQEQLTKLYQEQYEALQKEMLVRNLTAAEVKEMEAALQDLSLAYWQSISTTKQMNKALEESQKQQAEKIANELIDSYKSYLQERRDEHIKSIDSEIKREEKRHEAVIDNYNEEMDLYRKNVEEKLSLIDEQESQRDYNMEMDDLGKERSDIQRQLDLLSMDDSYSAKAKRKDLQEQLDEIDKSIAEKRHDRDIELQKDALNKNLENKEEEIEKYIKIEDDKFDKFIENLESQKEYWDSYYNDMLNDERKFAQIRQDIMSGNFDAIETEFKEYIQQMSETMPLLENSMDGTMKAVGTSIRQNVIDALNEAIKLMNEFEQSKQTTPGGIGGTFPTPGGSIGSGSNGGGGGKSSLSQADMKVVLAKYMREQLAELETNPGRADIIRNKAGDLAAEGRTEGSDYKWNDSLASILTGLSKQDLLELGNYINRNATSVVITPYLQEYIKAFAQKLLQSGASLSTGGQIPKIGTGGIDGKGGRSVIVHPDEIINNPLDSQRLLSMANVLERAVTFLSPIISKLPTITKNLTTGGETFVVNFGDVNNATQAQAESFAKEFINNVRVRKGGR